MQALNIHRPEMPEFQFVLFVTALCTSRVTTLNIPAGLRTALFDRCWVLIHDSPPPRNPEARVLDLRPWTELTVEAMAETIRWALSEAGIQTLAWDHLPNEATLTGPPEARVLMDRLARHASEGREPAIGEAADGAPHPPTEEGSGGACSPR